MSKNKKKRTVLAGEDLHPDALIENHIYEVTYTPYLDQKHYTVVERVVFKGMLLPTSAEDDNTLVILWKLMREPSKKEKKIFTIQWSKVVQIDYLHETE